MKSQNRHNISQARASPRGSQATPQRKQSKQQRQQSTTTQLSSTTSPVTQNLPFELQQAILDVFTQAFSVTTQSDVFKQLMQEVKGHLYNRDFLTAFGRPEYLDVYAARWSAARALAYADIFTDSNRHTWFQPVLRKRATSPGRETSSRNGDTEVVVPTGRHHDLGLLTGAEKRESAATFAEPVEPQSNTHQGSSILAQSSENGLCEPTPASQGLGHRGGRFKVVVLGGGAGAEIAALAAAWRYLHSQHKVGELSAGTDDRPPDLDILAVDIADWSQPVAKLSSALNTPPTLPSYASQAVRDTNCALVSPKNDGNVAVTFSHQDLLHATLSSLQTTLSDVSLVTIMFTLNELFTASLSKTTALLLNLTESVKTNAHLVIIDSPGSYSEIKLGRSGTDSSRDADAQTVKKYPMKWLLDHTLLEVAGKADDAKWVKIEDEESKWFRINEKLGLRYGVELENCRYQIHVFRKLK